MRAPPNSPTWFSWWSSTSSTEGCCLVNSNTRAPPWPYDPPTDHSTWLSETTRPFASVGSFCLYLREKLVNWLIESLLSFLYCWESYGDCWLPGFLLVSHVWGVGCTTCSQFSAVKKRWFKIKKWNNIIHCRVNWCCCKIFHNHAALSHQKAWTQSIDFSLLSWTITWLSLLPENSHFNQTSSHVLQTVGS